MLGFGEVFLYDPIVKHIQHLRLSIVNCIGGNGHIFEFLKGQATL